MLMSDGTSLYKAILQDSEFVSFYKAKEDYVSAFAETLISVEQEKLTKSLGCTSINTESNTNDNWRESRRWDTFVSGTYKALKSDLGCSLCRGLLFSPITLVCGHTFCMSCIKDEDKVKVCTTTTTTTTNYDTAVRLVPPCPTCSFSSPLKNYSINCTLRDIVRATFPDQAILEKDINSIEEVLKSGCNTNQAFDQIEQLLQTHPNNVRLICLRARIMVERGEHDKALRDLEDACKLYPFEGMIFFRRGVMLTSAGSHENASAMYLRACALQPHNRVYRASLITCLRALFRNFDDIYTPSSLTISTTGDVTKGGILSQKQWTISIHQEQRSGQDMLPTAPKVSQVVDEESTETMIPCRVPLEQLQCQLCYNSFYEPVATPCGHTFCKECLLQALDHRSFCPLCRTNLEQYQALVITKGHQGVCQEIERIQRLFYEQDYKARKIAHDLVLRHVIQSDEGDTPTIPIFVCTLALPNINCPLHIFEPRYKLMIRRCLENGSRQFGMCLPDAEHQFALVGTMLEILSVEFLPDGRSVIHTIGGTRFKILTKHTHSGYNTATVEWLVDDNHDCTIDHSVLVSEVYTHMIQWFTNLENKHQTCIVQALGRIPDKNDQTVTNGFKWLWWLLAAIPLNHEAKLIILSMTSVEERLISMKRFLELLLKQQGR